jgi:hypothetical protein
VKYLLDTCIIAAVLDQEPEAVRHVPEFVERV